MKKYTSAFFSHEFRKQLSERDRRKCSQSETLSPDSLLDTRLSSIHYISTELQQQHRQAIMTRIFGQILQRRPCFKRHLLLVVRITYYAIPSRSLFRSHNNAVSLTNLQKAHFNHKIIMSTCIPALDHFFFFRGFIRIALVHMNCPSLSILCTAVSFTCDIYPFKQVCMRKQNITK